MNVKIYHDEKGDNFDEYIVVIGDSVFTMSINALSPIGVNQYCCDADELDMDYIKSNTKEMSFIDLPFQVREAIRLRIADVASTA